MTAQELVAGAILKATGEVWTGTWGDADSAKMLAIANACIDDWRDEPGVDWESLYDPSVESGTVSETDTYELNGDIYTLSNREGDYIYIQNTDGSKTKYATVAANLLKKYPIGNYCARVGHTLRFNKTFQPENREYGGTIYVPAYFAPIHLIESADIVPVDSPNWLVVSAAAEWTRNDITLSQNYPGLVAQANNLMAKMKQANGSQVTDIVLEPAGDGADW